ncbi:long-chain acyl-CoA synthetase [Amycolatopsis bartoniae]|uniref:Long-chain acyl-CoA synthetase n=1 Tax=Amycolatopsis bartoniae TaxID=941986 RepID=A0A8H9ISM8_9PSEU|nr:AMP-binding protein [Amycolatopsis bartoniae]MBB2939687.1 long-chain acyl-CoA synthetase [Amycolatopsis bartoniae]TVT06192.1 AMP-binding protein [Amycolatopsis bartoniae]GHF36498.1 long-chain acyl-CoA synthetase [Amycolatopsis bartoniae]
MVASQILSLGDVAREHRRSRPELPAVVDGDVRLSYRELDTRANRVASALRARGVERGSRVVWFGQNSFKLLELIVAASKAGAVVVPLNWREHPASLAGALADADPRMVFWQDEEIGETVGKVRASAAEGATWIQADAAEYDEFVASGTDTDDEEPVRHDEPVLGIYTATKDNGLTAALLSHLGIFVESLAVGRANEISDATVFLNSGPMFHMGTLVSTLATFHHGGTNVFLRRVEPLALCELIEQERCDRAFLTPPTVAAMREIVAERQFDLSSLWPGLEPGQWHSVTPSLNPTTGRSGSYGQSEIAGLGTFAGLGRAPGSPFGRPLPTVQVRILDPEGRECEPGQVGELVFRGPTVTVGFLGRPDLDEKRFRNGWLHSGDLGLREIDGSIRFVAPMGRLIKSASENIHPADVERCLAGHPAVKEVCVIGVPDTHWGQVVKALVVPVDGATPTLEELAGFARERIASFKKPRLLQIVDAIPRGPGGQVDRAAADELGGGGGYPGEHSGSAGHVAVRQ